MQTAEEKDLAAQSALHLWAADHLLPQDSPSVYANSKNALINRSSVSQSVSQQISFLWFLLFSSAASASASSVQPCNNHFAVNHRKERLKGSILLRKKMWSSLPRTCKISSCLLLSIWILPEGILAMDHHLCELPILISILKQTWDARSKTCTRFKRNKEPHLTVERGI